MQFGFLVRLSVVLAITLAAAHAQESRAIIDGNVTGGHGAGVPAATVEVRNLETNVISKTATNERGLFTVPRSIRAIYPVSVSRNGAIPMTCFPSFFSSMPCTARIGNRRSFGGQ